MSTAGTPTYPAKTIAKLFMLTERRIQQLAKEGIIPKAERGRYELAPAVQGYIRFLQERSLNPDNAAAIDFSAERARKIKAEADIAEIEAAKRRGDVADISTVRRSCERAFAEVRANLRNIPGRVATQVLGDDNESRVKALILNEIDLALSALSDGFEIIEDETDE